VIAEGTPIRRQRKDAAYLTIMYGCDNFCSYCIVPYVRGRERSRRLEEILKEAERLYAGGVKEVMLLGQNVNSYGKGLSAASGISDDNRDISFPALLSALDEIGIPRIRFMTSHPKDLSDELIETMSESNHILPQFHLPVQSGSNRILEEMNRHYTREQYMERVNMLRSRIPGIGLSTDIIVGFPGETDADFEETKALVKEVCFDSAFTFIYSPRVGTRAASMPDQVPADVASRRIQELIRTQEAIQQETMKRFVGNDEEVLVESISRRSTYEVSGKGRHGISITMPGNHDDIGKIIRCRVTGIKNNTLTAEKKE
jgi:tRNA-2-methylthio-N6-dimethylallyladenosine synthase